MGRVRDGFGWALFIAKLSCQAANAGTKPRLNTIPDRSDRQRDCWQPYRRSSASLAQSTPSIADCTAAKAAMAKRSLCALCAVTATARTDGNNSDRRAHHAGCGAAGARAGASGAAVSIKRWTRTARERLGPEAIRAGSAFMMSGRLAAAPSSGEGVNHRREPAQQLACCCATGPSRASRPGILWKIRPGIP